MHSGRLEERVMKGKLEKYTKLVEFLGHAMGKQYEIVLQDLSADKQSIVAIANGHVSGREVGSPLTDYALRAIASGAWKQTDFQCNYSGITKDGRVLRSSTYFIKEEGDLLGMLCINVDTNIYKQLSEEVLRLGGVTEPPQNTEHAITSLPHTENFSDTVTSITNEVVKEICEGNIPLDRLTQSEKMAIVEELNKRGLFLLKGAVCGVAGQLSCSEASIYRYLAKLTKQHKISG